MRVLGEVCLEEFDFSVPFEDKHVVQVVVPCILFHVFSNPLWFNRFAHFALLDVFAC